MVVEISAGDLLITTQMKEHTHTTSHLHIDQCNIPSAARINVVLNKGERNKDATARWKEPEVC